MEELLFVFRDVLLFIQSKQLLFYHLFCLCCPTTNICGHIDETKAKCFTPLESLIDQLQSIKGNYLAGSRGNLFIYNAMRQSRVIPLCISLGFTAVQKTSEVLTQLSF